MTGLHEAASSPGGTSYEVWKGWDQTQLPVYGKTGTAQHSVEEDQSWYMCYIGDPSRPIVIAVTVEQGGFGAETAAPIARLMASQWFHKPKKFVAGELGHLLMPLSPIKTPEEMPVAPPRALRLPFDPLLTLAVLGLGIASILTLRSATEHLIPTQPHYYVDRQAIYLGSASC